jgi:hypothetical protein
LEAFACPRVDHAAANLFVRDRGDDAPTPAGTCELRPRSPDVARNRAEAIELGSRDVQLTQVALIATHELADSSDVSGLDRSACKLDEELDSVEEFPDGNRVSLPHSSNHLDKFLCARACSGIADAKNHSHACVDGLNSVTTPENEPTAVGCGIRIDP